MSDHRVRVDCDDIGCGTVFIAMLLLLLLAKPLANQVHQGWLQGGEEYRQEKSK